MHDLLKQSLRLFSRAEGYVSRTREAKTDLVPEARVKRARTLSLFYLARLTRNSRVSSAW